MARSPLVLLAAVVLLAGLAAVPPASAQANTPPATLVEVFWDDFNSATTNGWTTATGPLSGAGGEDDEWSRISDGALGVWYASRTTATNEAAGYSNNADVILTSPTIAFPASFHQRSVNLILRGSSEETDVLTLQWAKTTDAAEADWETLHQWSDVDADLESSYKVQDYSSNKFLAHSGSFAVRLRFTSDSSCDSNPGDTAIEPVLPPLPPAPDGTAITPPTYMGPFPDPMAFDPGTPPSYTGEFPDPTAIEPGVPPSYTGPTPDPSAFDPGTPPSAGGTPDPTQISPPTVNYDPTAYDPTAYDPTPEIGEDSELGGCGTPQFQGWFIDRLSVIGRRDFTAFTPADAPRLPLGASGADLTVDLLADKGKLIAFTLDPTQVALPSGTNAILVNIDRQSSSDVLNLAAPLGEDGLWTGLLAVDEPDLVTGTWDVGFFANTNNGGSLVASRTLTVKAQDAATPKLTIFPTGTPVKLGPGSSLTLEVQEAFLRRVMYTFPGLPTPIELPAPYLVPVASFPEGPSAVTFTATDRTGHQAKLDVSLERDTVRPVVAMSDATTLYEGVPFDLGISIVERSAHHLHVDAGGTLTDLDFKAGDATLGKTTVLRITPPAVGELTVTSTVLDAFGNSAVRVQEFTVVKPVTDLKVTSVKLVTPTTNIAKEGHGIVAIIEQVGGVAPLPVEVTFEAAGRSQTSTIIIPAKVPAEVRWNVTLPPGVTTVKVHAQVPAIANETNPGNENGTLNVESFLGRITSGTKVYNIRSDARGFPATAILSGTTKTFPLKLADSGAGVAYQFTVEGNRTITWDPLVPVSTVAPDTTSTSSAPKKDAPFPGLEMALVVLALALLVQRRR